MNDSHDESSINLINVAPVTTTPSISQETYYSSIQDYIYTNLHLKRSNNNRYYPYSVGHFLFHHEIFHINDVMVTKAKLIEFMVWHKLVPIRKSSLYNMSFRVSQGLVDVNAIWTVLTHCGPKAYLTSRELKELIVSII